jgi:hypothetical protein
MEKDQTLRSSLDKGIDSNTVINNESKEIPEKPFEHMDPATTTITNPTDDEGGEEVGPSEVTTVGGHARESTMASWEEASPEEEEEDEDKYEEEEEDQEEEDEEEEEEEEDQVLDLEAQNSLLMRMMLSNDPDIYTKMDMARILANASESGVNLFEMPSMREFTSEEDKRTVFQSLYGQMKTKNPTSTKSRAAEVVQDDDNEGPPTPKNLYEALQSSLLRNSTVMRRPPILS